MQSLIDIPWPHKTNEVLYVPRTREGHCAIKTLEINIMEEDIQQVQLLDKSLQEHLQFRNFQSCCLRMFVVTASWQPAKANHEKRLHYDIGQRDFTEILENVGLTRFFCQTRQDVTGLFTHPASQMYGNDTDDKEYFAIIYDAFYGLWARYDHERGQWQGVYTIAETTLNLRTITMAFITSVPNIMLLYMIAAKHGVDFFSLRSGELPKQVADIERHSGHHHSILRPVPAVYDTLERLSANATGTANLTSYWKTVVSPLLQELLKYLESTIPDKDNKIDMKQVTHLITDLKSRLRSLSAYLTFLERRAERQVTATLHLVNQSNARTNLAVAHDTNVLSIAAKQDSTSMKILATVTTTFLPGAFVAALFSMNMFDWFASSDDGVPVVSKYFWIYWAIAIPLTAITIGTWQAWEVRARKDWVRSGS